MICDYIICDKVFDKISPMIHREREREREMERGREKLRCYTGPKCYTVLHCISDRLDRY